MHATASAAAARQWLAAASTCLGERIAIVAEDLVERMAIVSEDIGERFAVSSEGISERMAIGSAGIVGRCRPSSLTTSVALDGDRLIGSLRGCNAGTFAGGCP